MFLFVYIHVQHCEQCIPRYILDYSYDSRNRIRTKTVPKTVHFGNFDVKWSVILIEWRLKNDIFDPKITIFVTIVLNYIVNKWLSKLEGGFG